MSPHTHTCSQMYIKELKTLLLLTTGVNFKANVADFQRKLWGRNKQRLKQEMKRNTRRNVINLGWSKEEIRKKLVVLVHWGSSFFFLSLSLVYSSVSSLFYLLSLLYYFFSPDILHLPIILLTWSWHRFYNCWSLLGITNIYSITLFHKQYNYANEEIKPFSSTQI